jgi:hypothetical protein
MKDFTTSPECFVVNIILDALIFTA